MPNPDSVNELDIIYGRVDDEAKRQEKLKLLEEEANKLKAETKIGNGNQIYAPDDVLLKLMEAAKCGRDHTSK